MMFVTHGLVGAAVTVQFVLWCNCMKRKVEFWLLASLGFILGSMADSLDGLNHYISVVLNWFGLETFVSPQYGPIYQFFHHYVPVWVWFLCPPLGLHLWMDSKIHLYPGYNWWPDFWWLEVFPGVLSLVVLRIAWVVVHKEREA